MLSLGMCGTKTVRQVTLVPNTLLHWTFWSVLRSSTPLQNMSVDVIRRMLDSFLLLLRADRVNAAPGN